VRMSFGRVFTAPSVACIVLLFAGGAATTTPAGHVRTYYIAADEVNWNYCPMGINETFGRPYNTFERTFTQRTPHRIGCVYRKAIYRQYTDATFRTLKLRPPDQRYLGILGPIIHAEVGDTIRVVFRNNASRPYSMHPHGVFYSHDSEGVKYNDGVPGSGGEVPPHHTYTYTWYVPERAGPGPNDPSSIVWLYHSHVNDQRDIDSGLVGAIIVTRRGMANPDGTPKDVDREFVALFEMFDENQSWYLDHNIATYAPAVTKTERSLEVPIDTDNRFSLVGAAFADSNFKFTINGYIYGNGPRMVMRRGEHVRWYVIDLGNGINFHTPHWHGNTVLLDGRRTDVLALSPAQMVTADMVPDDVGTWLFHCHVADHMRAGMNTLYEVLP
jgi:FtsP/CotA-like multicopper oxidase with cupredoxin domain